MNNNSIKLFLIGLFICIITMYFTANFIEGFDTGAATNGAVIAVAILYVGSICKNK